MVEGHTGGRASWRLRAALLAAVGTVALLGPAAVAGGTSVAPQRVAIVVFENKDYDASLDATGTGYVVGDDAAPYINTVVDPRVALARADPGRLRPSRRRAGGHRRYARAPRACSSPTETRRGFRTGASAPEYAWMVQATDANVRDRSFPDSLNPGKPEGGIVGYAPGHNDTSGPVYDLFGYMEAN